MKNFSKKIFFIVLIILSITALSYSQDQFQVEIKCDKEIYYSRDLPDITISLENKGEERNIDLYVAYTNPYGLLFFSSGKSDWQIFPVPDWPESVPQTYISNIKIPQGFKLPPVSISRYFNKNAFPKFDMPSSQYTANPFVFGNYTFYIAVVDSETKEVLSNISSYQIEFRKLPEKKWSSITNSGIGHFAWDNDTIWGTSGNGICILDTKTGSFERHTKYGGLIDGAVLDVAVDSKGRKWFMNYGLALLDGENWDNFNGKKGNFPYWDRNSDLRCIAVDYNDRVWVGFGNGTADVYDGTTWTRYSFPDYYNNSCISVISPCKDGKILFGTQNDGLFIFDGENWVNYNTKNSSIPSDNVTAISVDSSQNAWIGAWDNGAASFDGESWTNYDTMNSSLQDLWITSIAVDQENRKWFGTNTGGVSVFDNTSWVTYTIENSGIASNRVSDILVDPYDRVWFSLGYSVSMFDGTNWESYNLANAKKVLTDSKYIVIDSKGNKWMTGINSTLSCFDGENWTYYTPENSALIDSPIDKIAVDTKDRIWLAYRYEFGWPNDNGVTMFDGENWHVYNSKTTPDYHGDIVYCITADPEDRVWVGTKQGLYIFDGNWTMLDTPDNDFSSNADVISIDFDSKGNAWIGTSPKGIFVYDGQNWINYSSTSNNGYIGADNISELHIDNLDRKWISCHAANGLHPEGLKGVLIFDDKEWINYNRNNSHIFEWQSPTTITSDSDGKIYFGDQYGLTVFDGTNWITYDVFNSEILSNNVESIAIDLDGKKWIGSGSGISILDDSEN